VKVRNWEYLHRANFCKNRLRGKFIPKITVFGAVSPHFKAPTVKFHVRVRTLDSLPTPNFVNKNCSRVFVPYGKKILLKIRNFREFELLESTRTYDVEI